MLQLCELDSHDPGDVFSQLSWRGIENCPYNPGQECGKQKNNGVKK
jgi:hypothetical protein